MENELYQVHKTKRIYQTFLSNLAGSFLQAALLLWGNQRKNNNHRHGRRKEGGQGPLDFEIFSKKGCFL